MASSLNTPLAPSPGDPLPDEDPDIRAEAGTIFADPDKWLDTENSNLGGRKPNDLVQSGQAEAVEAVRNLLRSIKYIGVS